MGIHSSISVMHDESEAERLAVLNNLHILDTAPEREFDTIVQCVRDALGCAIALVSLVDDQRQWFKAKCGLDATETPREQAFCAHAILRDTIMIVPNALKDPRFASNPLVTGAPHIRFYAGVPLRVAANDGPFTMGTLCAIDDAPRTLSPDEEARLIALAHLVESLLQARADAASAIRIAEERRAVVHRLSILHHQFRQAERMANIGSWRMTLADGTLEWSDQVYAIHGLPVGGAPALDNALDYYPPSARPVVAAAVERAAASGESWDIETDFLTAQGELRRVHSMGEVEIRDGKRVAITGVFRDVTRHYQMEQALRQAAHIDVLTGIANRAHFNERADAAIAQAKKDGTSLAVALIDLDHFKAVNDRCGHPIGDDLLQRMAVRLQATYLAGCTPARLGGDEFVLLATGFADQAALADMIARLLADLVDSVDTPGGTIGVSGTIGIAILNDDIRDRSDLLLRADIALYEAKHIRRGTAKINGTAGLILPAFTPQDHAKG